MLGILASSRGRRSIGRLEVKTSITFPTYERQPAIKDFVLERLDRLDRFSELSKRGSRGAVGGKEPHDAEVIVSGKGIRAQAVVSLTTYTRRLKEPLKKWRKISA